jgi:hypothetical protein
LGQFRVCTSIETQRISLVVKQVRDRSQFLFVGHDRIRQALGRAPNMPIATLVAAVLSMVRATPATLAIRNFLCVGKPKHFLVGIDAYSPVRNPSTRPDTVFHIYLIS